MSMHTPPLAPLHAPRGGAGPASNRGSTGAGPSRATSTGGTPEVGSELQRWGAARRNAHDLTVTVDALERTLADAVYLDADAYHTHSLLQQYKEAVRAAEKVRDARLLTAETEMELMQRELAECKARCRRLETHVAAADALTATLQQEQENNAVVFRMHFTELLAKQEALAEQDQQITKLRGIIDVLQAGSGSSASLVK